jgi:hypothetical protein
MPCSVRYNLWIENDESSMTDEIQNMCGGRPETTAEGDAPDSRLCEELWNMVGSTIRKTGPVKVL